MPDSWAHFLPNGIINGSNFEFENLVNFSCNVISRKESIVRFYMYSGFTLNEFKKFIATLEQHLT